MTSFNVLILFGLVGLFPCKGEVQPPDGASFVFALGTIAKIKWSCTCHLPGATLRIWFFKNDTMKEEEEIASIAKDGEISTPGTSLPNITIETPATLVLNHVDRRYNGMYRFNVAIAGASGSTVKVTIAETPTVTVDCPGGTTVRKGEDITCICKGKDGKPPANVTWYDKQEMKIGETGTEETTLKLKVVDKNKSGKYKCVAFSHEKAQNETSIDIIVQFPPENVRVVFPSKTSSTAVRGEKFTITCAAEAEPLPTFELFFNETKVPINGNTYNIPTVNDSHIGFYKCLANNTLGANNSTARYLSVGNAGTHGNDGDDGGLGTGAIVGIIIGVLVLVLVVAVVCWIKLKKKNHGHERVKTDNPVKTPSGSTSSQPTQEPVTYAALDQKALKKGPEKPARSSSPPEPTNYAAIQVL